MLDEPGERGHGRRSEDVARLDRDPGEGIAQLAGELGVYDDDPLGQLGYLQSMNFRACRLVVDTGIHALHWNREQGIDFFVANNGDDRASVASEVDRYCAWPGQACGYMLGRIEINVQRDRAMAALGGGRDGLHTEHLGYILTELQYMQRTYPGLTW